ncbi:MAG: hypothetical protein HRU80_13040 [Ignavibacteriales bacterium]|nr:hypothetical protein [Ignavibacteriaceae bacterium]MCK6614519.1 hypothetical protein [Ignavibacteriaceae bacterium]QOJ29748.1 MAG: hypothetical protein HRU80_13040 [Ignavibacteriales bacterium]
MRKSLRTIAMVGVFGISSFFAGCGGVTEEQLAQLQSIKNEVSSLEKQVNSLKEQRARLEKEISDKNKKLEECAKIKQETQANLQKLNK